MGLPLIPPSAPFKATPSAPSVARGRAPLAGTIFDNTLGLPLISNGRDWVRPDGNSADQAWINLEGVSSATPTIALDFLNGRYFGASAEACLSKVGPVSTAPNRDGSTSQFAANALRITDVGLSYDGSSEVIQFAGPLLAAVNSSVGTLVVEFDYATTNNSTILSSVNGQLISRQGNGVNFANYNGGNLQGNTGSPGNGSNGDNNALIVAQKWNTATPTRSLSAGGGTVVTDANSVGNLSRVYIGRSDNGSQTYTGSILGIFFYPTMLTDAELRAAAFLSLTSKYISVAYGDSLPTGSGASPDNSASWRFLLSARYNNRLNGNGPNLRGDNAVPGTTSSQALTAMQGSTVSRQRIHFLWTGTNSPDAAQTLSDLKAMVAILSAAGNYKFLIFTPLHNSNSGVSQAINDTRVAIFANFHPANVVDASAVLGATINPDGSCGLTPAGNTADGLHPNNAGQILLANAVEAKLRGNGWL